MEARVSRRLLERLGAWLLSEDERGSAALGDLLELHAGWSDRYGATRAALLLALDLLRSAPGYLVAALSTRGPRRILTRTVPALLAGCAAAAAPGVLGGIEPHGAAGWPPLVAGLAIASGAALAGGWIAAGLAGAAPRQHGLAVGVALADLVGALGLSGWIEAPAWGVVAWQICVIVSAASGGARWRSVRRPAAVGRP
jgi:hypothetical protein